jgi:flagellar assembly factor FliW
MHYDTFLFGSIDVSPDAVLTFPAGMPGFDSHQRFTLIHDPVTKGDAPASYTLQSLDDPMVAFQIVEPGAFGFHYELEISDEETALLKIDRPEDVVVMLCLFRRDESPAQIEANMRAPILINVASRLGMQKVITHLRPNVTLSNLSTTPG